jgi:hypothetical protein
MILAKQKTVADLEKNQYDKKELQVLLSGNVYTGSRSL